MVTFNNRQPLGGGGSWLRISKRGFTAHKAIQCWPHQVMRIGEVGIRMAPTKVRQWHAAQNGVRLGTQLVHKDGRCIWTWA